ncbi:MAG: putative phosphatidylglycerophosphatase [Caulobacter sp.]|nr:putative phosphatidylglycerophosphatase [Caulobacter sp.]
MTMLQRLKRLEIQTLATMMAVTAAIWGFLHLSSEVGEKETLPIDTRLLLMLRNPANPSDPIGSRSFEESMRDLTALGGVTFLTIMVVIAFSALMFYRKRRQAWVFLGVVALAETSADLLKMVFDRARPTLVPHGSYVYSYSFPSGHSTMSAAVFLTLAGILASLEPKRRAKAFIFTVAVLLVIAIGFSRVYLGVHWPTDVLGGWTLGAAWAMVARLALIAWKAPEPTPEPGP